MPTQQKIAIVEETAEKMRTAAAIYFTDFKGLSAAKATELRAQLRENRIEYKVVKKTLSQLAAKEAGIGEIAEFLTGQVALAYTYEDPATPAKILGKFRKDNQDVPVITGIILDGQPVPASKAAELADLPAKDVLLAKLMSCLHQPMTAFTATLNGSFAQLLRVLTTLREDKT